MRLQKGKPVSRSVAKGTAMPWAEAPRMKQGSQFKLESENISVSREGLQVRLAE